MCTASSLQLCRVEIIGTIFPQGEEGVICDRMNLKPNRSEPNNCEEVSRNYSGQDLLKAIIMRQFSPNVEEV